jgi:hypothetical protein
MNDKISKRYLNQQVLQYDFDRRKTLWCITVEFTDGTTGLVNEWRDMLGTSVPCIEFAELDNDPES